MYVPHPPTETLDWSQSAELAGVLFVIAAVLSRLPPSRWRKVMPFVREAGIVALLYSLWEVAGLLSNRSTSGAFTRADWIIKAEHTIHLPSERSLQQPLIDHPVLGQLANLYYAVMHLSAMGALLFWLFWRHRARYSRIRTAIAIFTGLASLVQLVPVAPPRLMPGYLDVAEHYGQSVYSIAGFSADQLLAMPSIHVGWSVLIAGAVIHAGTSRWRWLVLLHPIIMIYVVSATGNHWWFDGLASIIMVTVIVAGQSLLLRWWARRRDCRATEATGSTAVSPDAATPDQEPAVAP